MANALYELREKLLIMPFCFNKCKKTIKRNLYFKKRRVEYGV